MENAAVCEAHRQEVNLKGRLDYKVMFQQLLRKGSRHLDRQDIQRVMRAYGLTMEEPALDLLMERLGRRVSLADWLVQVSPWSPKRYV